MYVPKPDETGVRRYNQWAGNPRGHAEDVTRCVMQVTPNEPAGFARAHQCNRKRGHGPDGLYCKQHDPAAQQRRNAEADARYRAQRHRETRPYRQRDAYEAALRQIAEGHNDPRTLAIKALETD